MNLSQILRVYGHCISAVEMCRHETPRQTIYISSRLKPLVRQRQALALLAHLEIAPAVVTMERWRGFYLLITFHPPSQGFLSKWRSSSHAHQVEMIRRLGATMGMVHSLRDVRTGPVDRPRPLLPGKQIVAELKLHHCRRGDGDDGNNLVEAAKMLWTRPCSSLVGGWNRFPDLKVWENGLVLMDFTRARYFDPLWDLVRLDPGYLNWQDSERFWEYFLQGYCASGELPERWREKLTVLAELTAWKGLAHQGGRNCPTSHWWDNI